MTVSEAIKLLENIPDTHKNAEVVFRCYEWHYFDIKPHITQRGVDSITVDSTNVVIQSGNCGSI